MKNRIFHYRRYYLCRDGEYFPFSIATFRAFINKKRPFKQLTEISYEK
jgi:hypothetical protein